MLCAPTLRSLDDVPSPYLEGTFAPAKGHDAGVWGTLDLTRETLAARLDDVLGVRVRMLAGGSERLRRVGVITGGAGSMIGTELTAKAPPDGHTIVLNNIGLAINETLYKTRDYKLADLTAVAMPAASAESIAAATQAGASTRR